MLHVRDHIVHLVMTDLHDMAEEVDGEEEEVQAQGDIVELQVLVEEERADHHREGEEKVEVLQRERMTQKVLIKKERIAGHQREKTANHHQKREERAELLQREEMNQEVLTEKEGPTTQ